ncbi:MAG: HEAT repeat domain-containing protein [Polyangiaceae bacterium]|nr:HEAT repeat domain-containing protein [Polyangiaceae bacterium]
MVVDDFNQLCERGRVAMQRGDLDVATNSLLAAAAHTHVPESAYLSVLRPLFELFVRRNDPRSALTVVWYMASSDPNVWGRVGSLLASVPAVDRARSRAAVGDMEGAAREMEDAGLLAAAAIWREKAGSYSQARALWSRLAVVASKCADAYNAALVQYNLARCANLCADPKQAREAAVSAVRLLEEAADYFESIGQRERAFDCFQVLVQIGRESGTFEDVLEGFINCIRILREDHLKYFALQCFEDALSAAKERGELSAAATLAREASDYARTLAMQGTSAHYTVMQAELWREVSKQHLARGAPPEIAENALLAAILAFGEVGSFARIGALYTDLATMDLDPQRKAHYARAAKRYEGVRDEAIETTALPAHVRQDSHFPEVWHVDLIEWEEQGSAAEACADVLLDGKRWPDLIRRKAMLARLTALAVENQPHEMTRAPAIALRVKLADDLRQLQLFAVLSPLEKLFAGGEQAVKIAVLSAMQQLFFKRSFVTVRAGLRDSDPAVVQHATVAVESLFFQHAFDPLSRIVREAPEPAVRAAALRALSRVDTIEAAEFLLGTLEHGSPTDRTSALHALQRSRGGRFTELARTTMYTATPDMQALLRDVMHARGIAI